MAIVRRMNRGGDLSPWSALRELETEFNRFFGDFGKEVGFGQRRFMPAVDLRETDDAFIVEADIPGMKKEDIHIDVVEDVLTIRGERKEETERKEKDFHRVERQYGSFVRSVEIPGGFNPDQVNAKFEDGVLRVTLPKREESKPRSITVNAE